MTLEFTFSIILIAVSYYLFSNEFFKFAAAIKGEKVSYGIRFLSFLLIYVWFMIASLLELPLVVNWFVFMIILGLEVHFVFSFGFQISYALALFCVSTGLAVNVCFRSIVSIVLRVPLNIFDNSMSSLKTYPIFLGFMVMVILLVCLRHFRFHFKLKTLLDNKKSLTFYVWTEIFIYLFLMIQLLAFTESENIMGIKTWGIKAALFSFIILVMANIYALRVASLNYYMDKRHEMQNHLIQEKEDLNKLWKLAFTDILTGCNNRQLLNKRLEEYAGYGGSITLAFIDLNGLKIVNDQFGHMEGDNYLICTAQTLLKVSEGYNVDLFRYGGDEFVMLSNTLDENKVTELLVKANALLKEKINGPYKKSVSYGVVHGDCADYPALITQADEIMYKNKISHYEETVRS